jgi:hypothetical protein
VGTKSHKTMSAAGVGMSSPVADLNLNREKPGPTFSSRIVCPQLILTEVVTTIFNCTIDIF